ncbi:MAG TPA: hypothetical protein V6C95_21120, partial [Coleofasciculaceae cyanobacterium]
MGIAHLTPGEASSILELGGVKRRKQGKLMQGHWRVGSLLGIPLFLDPSWFFILALVTIINALDFYPHFGIALALSTGLIMALLLFSSVVLHELGHSV